MNSRRMLIIAWLMVLTSSVATGGSTEVELDHWMADLQLRARIDPDTGMGTIFDFEDDIGVDGDEALNGIQLLFNPGRRERHHVFLSYAATDFSGASRLDRDITVGDTVYLSGDELSLDLDYAVGRLYYGFSFLDRSRVQLGFQLGLFALATDGEFRSAQEGNEPFDIVAPVPVVGLHLQLEPGERHRIRLMGTGLPIDLDDVEGDVLELEAQYQFFPRPWVGIGIGYRSFSIDVEVIDEGLLDLEQDGLLADLTFRW